MKKLFVLLVFAVVAIAANAQIWKTVTATEADSSKGAETDYIYIPNVGGFDGVKDLSIQTLCTQLGGTSDGTITIQKSVDGTSYKSMLTSVDTDLIASNDTLTITNGAVLTFRLKTYAYKYRLKVEGTSGDSTIFVTRYLFK